MLAFLGGCAIFLMAGLWLTFGFRKMLGILCLIFAFLLFLIAVEMTVPTAPKVYGAEREGWFIESQGVYQFGLPSNYTAGKITCAGGKFLNDWSSVRLEFEVGKVWLLEPKPSGSQFGGSFMLRFDPRLYKKFRFFSEAGVGIGYANITDDQKFVEPGTVGLIDAGFGVTFPLAWNNTDFILGWRFSHISSVKPGDKGMNQHGIGIGLIWRF